MTTRTEVKKTRSAERCIVALLFALLAVLWVTMPWMISAFVQRTAEIVALALIETSLVVAVLVVMKREDNGMKKGARP